MTRAPDEFTAAYLQCALWSSTGDDGEPLDSHYGNDDPSDETIAKAWADCDAFYAANSVASKTPRDWDTIAVLDPTKLTDPEAFLAECARRQSTDPDKWQPFEDLNDVRALARKYAKPETSRVSA